MMIPAFGVRAKLKVSGWRRQSAQSRRLSLQPASEEEEEEEGLFACGRSLPAQPKVDALIGKGKAPTKAADD
jgi:hypothetical protein